MVKPYNLEESKAFIVGFIYIVIHLNLVVLSPLLLTPLISLKQAL